MTMSPLKAPRMIMNKYIRKQYSLKSVEEAKARTITPMNLVKVIPTSTELPISPSAFLALSSLVPVYFMKFIAMWLQNSTPKPKLVTRLTTRIPFISISKPPQMIFSIHIVPMSSKKTRNTLKTMNTEIWMLERIYNKRDLLKNMENNNLKCITYLNCDKY